MDRFSSSGDSTGLSRFDELLIRRLETILFFLGRINSVETLVIESSQLRELLKGYD